MDKPGQLGLSAVEAEPLHEKVYQEITRALISGQFEPGQKLTSRKLAKALGTSDMPVRSALQRLQALRALRQLPSGIAEVPVMTREHFRQLMDARTVVEGGATLRAAARINGNNMRAVRRLAGELDAAAEAGEIAAYLSANYSFKFAIYRHCDNEAMIFLIETLWMQVGPFLRRFAEGFDGQLAGILAIDYHGQALEALEAGDGQRAADAIVRDIEEGASYLLANARFADS